MVDQSLQTKEKNQETVKKEKEKKKRKKKKKRERERKRKEKRSLSDERLNTACLVCYSGTFLHSEKIMSALFDSPMQK